MSRSDVKDATDVKDAVLKQAQQLQQQATRSARKAARKASKKAQKKAQKAAHKAHKRAVKKGHELVEVVATKAGRPPKKRSKKKLVAVAGGFALVAYGAKAARQKKAAGSSPHGTPTGSAPGINTTGGSTNPA